MQLNIPSMLLDATLMNIGEVDMGIAKNARALSWNLFVSSTHLSIFSKVLAHRMRVSRMGRRKNTNFFGSDRGSKVVRAMSSRLIGI